MKSKISILVAGDFVPYDRTTGIVEEGSYEQLFAADIVGAITSADFAIINLEAPIVKNNYKPIKKVGPILKAPSNTARAIRYAGFSMATIANNHINDYGSDGLLNTIEVCKKSDIVTMGAGKNRNEAEQTIIKETGGRKVAFINCCEHEFSITEKNEPGCNPLDPIAQSYAIKKAKLKADFVVVIVHGGIEHYQLPTPRMQKTYRFFVDAGADAVVNHHQHCFSGYEIYHRKPIIYGLGNFCFDWQVRDSKKWREGFVIKLLLGEEISIELLPYIQNDKNVGVRLMSEEEKSCFDKDIHQLNSIISDPEQLNIQYDQFLCQTDREMRAILSLYPGRILTALCRKGWLPIWANGYRFRRMLLNICCESHVERLAHYLKTSLK